ncbi:hypothetical protein T265_00398 [Opisthorchis viverrini]|uniref:Uncharacterized protein n=1 Tax=Opisthorchis viverrini TaxID=6198 RepID=A0A075AJN8_OPIVI|nr:hypothetical protein T265_00398 [Opisthorchis viverrini]KER33709.1 hypothetical protein T265_00398 [Opisthorchis viverrini]
MPDCPVEETGSILRLLLDSTGDVVSGGGFLRALPMLFEEVGAPRDAFKRLKSDNSLGEVIGAHQQCKASGMTEFESAHLNVLQLLHKSISESSSLNGETCLRLSDVISLPSARKGNPRKAIFFSLGPNFANGHVRLTPGPHGSRHLSSTETRAFLHLHATGRSTVVDKKLLVGWFLPKG